MKGKLNRLLKCETKVGIFFQKILSLSPEPKTYRMKKYKIGIIGAGHIAHKMASTLQEMTEAEAYAIASRDAERAAQFAGEHQMPKAYGSYEELVQDPNIDLVYIATPHSHHYAHAKLCLENGKPVLCEKAFPANARQAEELIELSRKKNVFITEAIWTRFIPCSQTIRQLIEEGCIGTPMTLTAGLSYPVAGKERIMRPELAGGALLDLGVYPINFALMTFGKDIEKITSTCLRTDTGVDAQNSITFAYRNGRMAVMQTNIYCAGDRQGIISGDKGYLIIDNVNNPQKATIYDAEHQPVREVCCPPQINGYEYEVLASIRALEEGRIETEEMPHEETLYVMRMLDAFRHEWGIRFPEDDF